MLQENLKAQKAISDRYAQLGVAKKHSMLANGEKERVLNFNDYLQNPDSVLDSAGAMIGFALTTYWKVSDPCREILAEKLQPLKAAFAKDIFTRGLFAAAQDSPSPVQMSMKDGVLVSCEKKDGMLTMTITKGKMDTEGYRHISFTCNADDPSTLAVDQYKGKHADIAAMIHKAAERFYDIRRGYAVMKAPGASSYKPAATKSSAVVATI